jgi:hypothetical protein
MKQWLDIGKALCPAIFLWIMGLTLSSGAQHLEAGTEIFPFLNLNFDARSVAMAGASAAMPNDCYGIFSNPAALGFVTTAQPIAGYRQISAGVFSAPLAYARPVAGMGTFAAGAIGLTSGAMNVTDIAPDGTPLETGDLARSDNYAGNVSWAAKISDDIAAGITIKGVYNYLSDGVDHWSADGVVFDGGMQYRSSNSRLMYGFIVHNIGLLRSGFVDDDTYPLPAAVELGVSYVPLDLSMLRLSLDLNKKINDYLLFEPGFELEVIESQLLIRGGYAVSWRDLQAFGSNLKGEQEENYFRTNRATLCLGIGVITELMDRIMKLDAGVEFSDALAVPALVLSLLTDL